MSVLNKIEMPDRIVTHLNNIDYRRWNAFVANSPRGHLMQSWEWGDFKEALGWRVQRVGLEQNGQILAGAQILFRSLPWLPLTIAYIPKGPIIDLANQKLVSPLFQAIHQVSREHRAIFLRIEPNLLDNYQAHNLLQQQGFQPTVQTNQPRSTIVIDLSESEEQLLANMRRKTRSLIRRAARDGVEVVQGTASDLDSFYQIIHTTAEIKGFPAHDKVFYHQAWQNLQANDSIRLMLAKYRGEVVAAKLICAFNGKSMHLWGGTSHKGRQTNASYLIQWESIKWAKAHGCQYCDLWGIPDEIGQMLKNEKPIPKDRLNGLWGVYHFKRGFGGDIESYVGAYDYSYWSFFYWSGIKIFGQRKTTDLISSWLEKISHVK